MTNHSLSPLSLPPLPQQQDQEPSPFPALNRLETLIKVLMRILKTPTSEKAGEVNVPVGALVELGMRLAGLNVQTPVCPPLFLTIFLMGELIRRKKDNIDQGTSGS